MSAAADMLRLWVLQEEQVVTYRRLSRELKVHVNIAKQAMLEFYEANRASCFATFLLTGTKRSGAEMNDGASITTEMVVKLVAAQELANAQQGLDAADSHIYSLGCHASSDKNVLVMANISAGPIRDIAEFNAVGSSVAKLPGLCIKHVAVSPTAPPRETKIATAASVESAESGAESSTDKPSTRTPAKASGQKSFFGRSVSKSTPVKSESGGTAETASTPVKEEPKSPAEPHIDSDLDMNDVEDVQLNTKRRVEDMFADDDSLDDFASGSESLPKQETQGTVAAASREASDIEMSDKADSQDMQLADSQSGSSRRVHKRRKVSRVKHTKNKRGMLVTQTVEEWESFSESEPEPTSRVTATKHQSAGESDTSSSSLANASKKSIGKSKSAVPQRSILSFFGKK